MISLEEPYLWEYTARKGYGFSPANNFVWNLKIKPGAIDKSPLRYRHNLEAIAARADFPRKI